MSSIHREWRDSEAAQATRPSPPPPPQPIRLGAPRMCHELGICHGRPGPGCTCNRDIGQIRPGGYFFAPGVIERSTARRKPLQRSAWRDGTAWAIVAVLSAVAAIYLVLKGMPL